MIFLPFIGWLVSAVGSAIAYIASSTTRHMLFSAMYVAGLLLLIQAFWLAAVAIIDAMLGWMNIPAQLMMIGYFLPSALPVAIGSLIAHMFITRLYETKKEVLKKITS